ncbi:DUF4900 domain-containing protein [bacterium]|nr:DUF4900 domain-containing protein [bacterium]
MGRFTLILVVGFTIVAGILRLNHNRLSGDAQELSNDQYLEATARNITNSMVNISLNEIRSNYGWDEGFTNLSLMDGHGNVTIVDATVDTTLASDHLRITTTGNICGESRTAVVEVRRTPFSEFAYFSNTEPPIFFITGDTLRGPIHTNGKFHISGNPVFYGLVSSVGAGWVGTGSPQFIGGTQFGSAQLDLPVDLSVIQGKAASAGMLFSGETYVEFISDGTFNWEVYTGATLDSSGNTVLSATNGVIATDNSKDIHVKGTLDGQATVLADGDILIDDDILYAADPLVDPTSDDILGLIAMHDVVVSATTANMTNCTIYASIMALHKSFYVEKYNQGGPRGTLAVIGGIIQEKRGPVGTAWYTTIRSGYSKNYRYDARFYKRAPPFYPILSRTSIISWYE